MNPQTYSVAFVASGFGNNVAVDDVNNQLIEIIKLDVGPPGVSIPVSGFVPVVLGVGGSNVSTNNPVPVQSVPITSGLTKFSFTGMSGGNALLTNIPTAVKGGAGGLYGFDLFNPGLVTTWIQIFDVASGSVVLGTTVPALTFPLYSGGGWSAYWNPTPLQFNTQIVFAATTTEFGGTAPVTSIPGNVYYE